jgi:hypothetical protein
MKSSSEIIEKQKKAGLLQWIIVLLTALLGGFVAAIIAGVVMTLVSSGGWPDALVTEFARGAALVIAGAKSSPRSRLATALVLAGVWTSLSLTIHVLLLRGSLGLSNYMAVVGTVAGAAGGIIFIGLHERKRKPGAN